MKQTLFLMLGYPGSGKTTTAHIIHNLTGATLIWADHERRRQFRNPTHSAQETKSLYGTLNSRAEALIAAGKSVVYDTNFNYHADREKMRIMAEQYGARTLIVWVRTPRDLAKHRATQLDESHSTRVLGSMPEESFERLSNNLQPPSNDEAYIVVDGTNVDESVVASLIGY